MAEKGTQSTGVSPAVAELLLLGAAMMWGVNFVVVKAALSQFQPHVFNSMRFVLAIVAMVAVMRYKAISIRPFSRQTSLLMLAGLLHTSFYQILFIEGIARTTASNSAMILAATPATVAVMGHVIGSEKIVRHTWAGIALAFGGLYLIIRASNQNFSLRDASFLGDVLVLCAMLLWAAYTAWARQLMQRFSVMEVTALSTIYGAVPLVLWSIPDLFVQQWQAVTIAGWGGVVYSGMFSITIAYFIWNASVQRVGAARTAIFSNLIPVFAVITGVVFLDETVSEVQLLGAVCVIAGIVLARRTNK